MTITVHQYLEAEQEVLISEIMDQSTEEDNRNHAIGELREVSLALEKITGVGKSYIANNYVQFTEPNQVATHCKLIAMSMSDVSMKAGAVIGLASMIQSDGQATSKDDLELLQVMTGELLRGDLLLDGVDR